MHGAIQPMPEIAGVGSATVGFMQMLSGALASALIAFLYDGRTAMLQQGALALLIAMSSVMAVFAIRVRAACPKDSASSLRLIASLAAYAGLARPAAAKS